MNRGNSGKGSA